MVAVTHSPRDAMEEGEMEREQRVDREIMDRTAFGVGRILVWLLAPGDVSSIGLRAYVIAYCLRPELIQGMTLQSIAEMRGVSRQFVHTLVSEFSVMFNVRSLVARTETAKREQANKWVRANPKAPLGEMRFNHLNLINRLSAWYNTGKHRSIDRTQLAKDFKPVQVIIESLQRF